MPEGADMGWAMTPLIVVVALSTTGSDPYAPGRQRSAQMTAELRAKAVLTLAHLHLVHRSIIACGEMADKRGRPDMRPDVPLAIAADAMRRAERAAGSVGIDVEKVWAATNARGSSLISAVLASTPESVRICSSIGKVLRMDLIDLQADVGALGSKEKVHLQDY
jgi:hypothetical protein